MADILVIYHKAGGCLDGFAAAWAVWDYYERLDDQGDKNLGIGQQMEFRAMDYGDTIPDLGGRVVYIVDLSFDPATLVEAAKDAVSVTLLDHHDSAYKKWVRYTDEGPSQAVRVELVMKEAPDGNRIEKFEAGNVVAYFATKMSGAVLTWRYLNIESMEDLILNDDRTPLLLQYCQDWDLHNLKLTGVKEVTAALYAKPWIRERDFANFGVKLESVQLEHIVVIENHQRYGVWGEINVLAANDVLNDLHAEGIVIYNYQVTMSHAMIARGVRYVTLGGHTVPFLAVPRELRTICGGIMAKGYPFSICYEDYYSERLREYSFRADKDDPNSVNVLSLLEPLGGGGHQSAAGVRVKFDDLGHDHPLNFRGF